MSAEAIALRMVQEAVHAARVGDTDLLTSLIDGGVSPDIQTTAGDSLVMLASYHGHHDTVQALLQRGADATVMNDRGQHPLAGATFKGDLRMVRMLLDAGVPADQPDRGGRTARDFAQMFERTAIAAVLDAAQR